MSDNIILYGDGVHDDTLAIQSMIDSGVCEVSLPAPKSFYLISKALELPSDFKLKLPRYAVIKLADNSNCFMLKNKTPFKFVFQTPGGKGATGNPFEIPGKDKAYFIDNPLSENIDVEGGIWDFNNIGQHPNPQQFPCDIDGYSGYCMLFFGCRNIRFSNLTIKNPANFGITIDTVSYFKFENITFDYNRGNPKLINMDGIHVNGNCHHGVMRNLYGTCYDDLVALNADEGSDGDITDVLIDGIFSENCHSAVRLLCRHRLVDRIHITNVFGTFYQYCIGITKFYSKVVQTGHFDTITLDNLYVSKAFRPDDYPWPDSYVYPVIFVEKGVRVKNLTVRSLHRREKTTPVETILVAEDATVDNLLLDDISVESGLEEKVSAYINKGTVKNCTLTNVREK